MSVTFSIVIPAHNEENYIKKALHSIKQQTYQNHETIVVTNGCTDKTEEIIKKRANEKLKHFNLNAANVSRARNYGASQAQGEYLLFLDADSTLEQDALQKIKTSFKDKHAVASTLSKPDLPKISHNLAFNFKNAYLTTKLYKGCSGALICRRTDFDKVNGYDADLKVREHRKLILKLLQHGKYKCVPTTTTVSTRRMKNWGLLKSSSFWVKQWFKDKFGDLKTSEYEKIR